MNTILDSLFSCADVFYLCRRAESYWGMEGLCGIRG
jgi:hypothetical protein